MKVITGTLNGWAQNLGIERASLNKRLCKANVTEMTGDLWKAKDVFRALINDHDLALTRKAIAEAEAQERENRIENGELVNKAEVERLMLAEWVLPIRQALESMPGQLADQLNPGDPAAAHKILQDFWESIKKTIRESTP